DDCGHRCAHCRGHHECTGGHQHCDPRDSGLGTHKRRRRIRLREARRSQRWSTRTRFI
ncbi:hypothetical protein H0H81_000246, partial [Sphagnurus paluster]